MYNHDYDFLWGTCSYIHRTKCWKEVLLLFTPRFLFVSQFPLSNHFILYSWLLLFFVQNRCGFVCRSMLAAGGCWHRCVGCRSGWVVAVWDLIQSETKGDNIFSHTRYCEQHNDAWGPCDYTNYDVSGCAYSLDCHNSDSTFFKKRWCFLRGQI